MLRRSGIKALPLGRLGWRALLTGLILMEIFAYGCASLQFFSHDGQPKLIGIGSVQALSVTGGQIYQISAPGLSLRVHSYAPGLSLGWHETLLFYPETDGQTGGANPPVAIQTRCAGINLGPAQIIVGFARSFAVPLPPSGTDVIQFISYSAANPTSTIVERKEM